MAVTRKLGRPPATSSEDTRERILDAARKCFAQHGFDATTNRQLADAAELTTGAIYHYFGSKLDLYVEAYKQVQELVYARFEGAASEAGSTFVGRITAVLDEALALNREDPSLANFLASVRTDSRRHDELHDDDRLAPAQRLRFFGELVDVGIANGEIHGADRQVLLDVIAALMMGLVSASSDDPDTHGRAVDGVKRLIAGHLISPSAPDPAGRKASAPVP